MDQILNTIEGLQRQLEIEEALERIRARAMAMHRTDELQEVLNTVYAQFLELNVDISGGAFLVINDDIDSQIVCWGAGGSADYVQKVHLPFMNMPIYTELMEGIKKRTPFFRESFTYEEKQVFFRELFTNPPYNKASAERKKEVLSRKGGYTRSCVVSEHTSIFIINHHGRDFTEEENSILRRMGKVFEQTYVRFLDLQKAEAQAREAQIEAALERVRARAMAMQNSEELQDVLSLLFQQYDVLGIQPVNVFLTLFDLPNDRFIYRASGKGGARAIGQQTVDLSESDQWKEVVNRFQEEESGGTELIHYPKDTLPTIFEIFKEAFTAVPEEYQIQPEDFPEGIYSTHGHNKYGYLGINHTRPCTEEEHQIIARFSKEFGQVYQRFLDIQKAEAQAREAQIEVALERIRARTMAMQHSEELNEVIGLLCEQYDFLGINPVCAHLTLMDIDNHRFSLRLTGKAGARNVGEQIIDFDAMEEWRESVEMWKASVPKSYRCLEYSKDSVVQLFEVLQDLTQTMPEAYRVGPADFPDGLYSCEGQNTFGYLGFNHSRPPTEEEIAIVVRFAREFERIYQRFLDLEKAEAQARESQIEAALERVRSKTMAMHTSEDVTETVITMFNEVIKLGLDSTIRCGIGILEGYEGMETWSVKSIQQGKVELRSGMLDMTIHPLLQELKKSWKQGKNGHSYSLIGNDVLNYYTALNNEPEYPFDADLSKLPEREYHNSFFFNEGIIFSFTENQLSGEAKNVLGRFASVFGQTYRRYLDLVNAEKQTREAQIEAALERVRSASMAMHKTDELAQVVEVLFKQFSELDLDFYQVWINIFLLEEGYSNCWFSPVEGIIEKAYTAVVPLGPFEESSIKSWRAGEQFSYLSWKGLEEVDAIMADLSRMTQHPSFEQIQKKKRMKRLEIVDCNHKYGVLALAKNQDISEEDHSILKRFTKVFEQTYTRFLDLHKAEQQAREAEIEAALERIRAKTMAMHNTDDIADTVITFFEELISLGLDKSMRAGLGILSQSEHMQLWTASVQETSKTILHTGSLDMTTHPMLVGAKRAWDKADPYFTYILKGKDLQDYFRNLNEAPDYPTEFDLDKLPEIVNHRSIPFTDGFLFIFTEAPPPAEIIHILERFAAVFGQTYTRYLDLQKAEKRARESRVEAAMERVRAQALAMHSSQDLRRTITAIFEELKNLDVKTIRLGLGLLNPDEPEGEIITSRIGDQGEIIEVNGTFRLEGHPVLEGVYAHFEKQEDFFPVLQGEEIITYYESLQNSVDVKGLGTSSNHYGCFLYFPEGALYAWAAKPHSDEQVGILKKFSRVVEITYRRYNDLIESEAREREAVKQASLDRVRAEISSMRTASDLGRITPLVWNELITLGVPFFRCGVFIVNEKEKKIHSYLSNPGGESLAAWEVGFGQIPVFDNMVQSWQKQEVFLIEWDRQGFLDFSQLLIKHGLVDDRERYQSGKDAPEHLVLHMMPFAQGMLYVGSQAHLEAGQMELVQSLANAFSVAYARYEDFNQLEKTLADLKATQAQLIQSEKMASLGELTAGIAHEIKNPLNFVNNFSDVTRELVEEMIEELKNGDTEEADAIARDVIQNLEKIVHHGQRADSIVKGMLQHSRSSDGQKEPTDLNELADEYLRLAYHGLRARDKSFNASMETDFDTSLEKVDVVPQDIGRVLLNLLTNAFHAVNERKASHGKGYDPTVWVKTQKKPDGVEISVRDNGGGIPDAIKDKIFQPFFTTKPTGQGTGLGLSLSYDIVKAHGGNIEVDSEEGKGTRFNINIPTA